MFDEKRLLKSVQTAEKGGITMSFSGENVYLVGQSWMAVTTWRRIREEYRGLLGHIVEVLGYFPENETVNVRKEKGKYMLSPVLAEVAAGEIAFFCEREREWPVQFTGLHWNGTLVQDQAGRIYRCALRGPHLPGDPQLTDGRKLVTRDLDADEAVFEIAYRAGEDSTDREKELWDHLESVRWTRWDGDGAEEWEQTEIEEEEDGTV